MFGRVGRRCVEAGFDGGDVTSDAELLLVEKADAQLGLIERVAQALSDRRDVSRIEHGVVPMLHQRVYGLVQGYEDLNDHDRLRHNLALQTALGKVTAGGLEPVAVPIRATR